MHSSWENLVPITFFFLFANIIWLSPQMKFKMKQFGNLHQRRLAIVPCWFRGGLIIYRLIGLKGTWQAYLIQWFLNLAEHQHLMGTFKKYRFLGIKPLLISRLESAQVGPRNFKLYKASQMILISYYFALPWIFL